MTHGQRYASVHRKTAQRQLSQCSQGLSARIHTKIVRDTETRLEIQLARHSYTASIETDGRTVKQDWDYRLLGVIEFKQGRIIRVYPLDEISVYKGEAEFPEDEGCTEEEWKNGYWAMDAFLSEGTID